MNLYHRKVVCFLFLLVLFVPKTGLPFQGRNIVMMTTGAVFVGGGLTFMIKSAQKNSDQKKISSNQIEVKLWLPEKEEGQRNVLPTP